MPLPSLADLPGIVVRQPFEKDIAVDAAAFEGLDVGGKAVLVHTGWDRHWRTDRYGDGHPFLTAAAADWLIEHGAALVGIDSNNIDDTRQRARPVHTSAARRRHPDLRAYDRPRRASGRGFPLLRGAAEGARHGNLPGARLRSARLSERALQPVGDDRIVGDCIDARDEQLKGRAREIRPAMRSPPPPSSDEEPAVDLLPPVHSRGVLLADEAALGEADAVQLGARCIRAKGCRRARRGLRRRQGEGGARAIRLRVRPSGRASGSEGGKPRVGRAARHPLDQCTASEASRSIADRAAQAIDRQPLDEIVRRLCFAVEEQVFAIAPRR